MSDNEVKNGSEPEYFQWAGLDDVAGAIRQLANLLMPALEAIQKLAAAKK